MYTRQLRNILFLSIQPFSDINVKYVIKCNDTNCHLSRHRSDIDCLYKNICDALQNAGKNCIPLSKSDYYKEHIVPGVNKHVKEILKTKQSLHSLFCNFLDCKRIIAKIYIVVT